MKAMCHHQTVTGLPKHCHNKLNQVPCTICYTEKMKKIPKGKTVVTTNLQPGELIQMDFVSYKCDFQKRLHFHANCILCKYWNDMSISY